MILEEPTITLQRFEAETSTGIDITIVLGDTPPELISEAARQFEHWTGRPAVVVDAPHEVYLSDPSVLTGVVMSLSGHAGPAVLLQDAGRGSS